jgi:NADP-dependent 3-hydroxy acid dehydrogenase YdfG
VERIWFITGCSSGFGQLLAETAFAMGDGVVATARSMQALRGLGRSDEGRILRATLDVRNRGEIDAAVAGAIEKFGRIDVLVNNAGYAYFSTQEEGDLEEVRLMYETNVFGLIATTQSVLPHMRSRGSGTIVNLSSVGGKMATPRGGFYQSSKWAVEALSEALYLEVSGFGIRVVVMEPGAYETDFAIRSARVGDAGVVDSPYAVVRPAWIAAAREKIFPYRQDPKEVIQGIFDAVDSKIPFVRLPIGRDAEKLIALRKELGDSAFVDWLRRTYGGESVRA